LASRAHVKDKHGGSKGFVCRKLVEAQKAREQDGTRSKIIEVEPLITQQRSVVNIWVEESCGSRRHKARR
jgi:hypothetical protein